MKLSRESEHTCLGKIDAIPCASILSILAASWKMLPTWQRKGEKEDCKVRWKGSSHVSQVVMTTPTDGMLDLLNAWKKPLAWTLLT